MEKQQTSQAVEDTQKPKKKEKEMKQLVQKKLTMVPPRLSDADFVKTLTPVKAITIYSAARALGVSAAVAKGVLSGLESRGLVAKVGGFSGHYVWTVAS